MPAFSPIVVTHGGAETEPESRDGPERAAQRGLAVIQSGGTALDAVVEAVFDLEGDERFNAGRGADVRLDGHTIQLDAAVLDSTGKLGILAAVDGVLHPIRAARALADTPHVMLVGEGARAFARRFGGEEGDPTTPKALDSFDKLRNRIRDGTYEASECEWTREGLREAWNFDSSWYSLYGTSGNRAAEKTKDASTVGAVAWDGKTFAAAGSTGGMMAALLGRVADTVMPGCGLEADARGAVAVSGSGEHVSRVRLATRLLARFDDGVAPNDAIAEALRWVPEHASLAIIAIDAQGRVGAGGKEDFPWAQAAAPRAVATAPPA
jgi:isoaspartyl peptidase/L-asparaginase-like protein (Ntn-hydrolase superfamily)